MSLTVRALLKEAGAAFAVLSLYMLMLLVPLHQSAASQRTFAELGYEAFNAWSICTATNTAQSDSDTPLAVSCPLTGIGKQDLAPGAGMGPVLAVSIAASAVAYGQFPVAGPGGAVYPDAPPRAPPASV